MAARKKSKNVSKSKKTRSTKAKREKRAAKKPTSKKLTLKKRTTDSSKRKRTRQRSGHTTRVYTHKEGVELKPETAGLRAGGQSGDLQGLPDLERADSESVDELLEEGNAFEAEAVAGVERVGDDEEREVHTHEVPEDDVPQEYLDKD